MTEGRLKRLRDPTKPVQAPGFLCISTGVESSKVWARRDGKTTPQNIRRPAATSRFARRAMVGPGYRRPISSASSRSSIESTRRTASEREQVSGKQLRKELGELESFGFDVDLIGFDLDQLKTILAALGTSGRTDSANFRLDVWNGPRTGFPSTTLLSTAERLGVVATGAAKPHRPERWRIDR